MPICTRRSRRRRPREINLFFRAPSCLHGISRASRGVALNLLNRRFSTSQLMSLAILIILASGTWLLTHELSIFNLVWVFTWLAIAQGISFPLSISMLLEPHKKQAGAVSALSGSIQMCLAGLLGGYLVESWVTTHLQLGVFYLIIGFQRTRRTGGHYRRGSRQLGPGKYGRRSWLCPTGILGG